MWLLISLSVCGRAFSPVLPLSVGSFNLISSFLCVGDRRVCEEGDRGRGAVRHHGPRAPAGGAVQPHLPQRAPHGSTRRQHLEQAQVQQLVDLSLPSLPLSSVNRSPSR